MTRREDLRNRETLFNRKNIGFSDQQVLRILGAQYILSRLQQESPTTILEYLIEKDRKERQSVSLIVSILKTIPWVQSVRETIPGSREDIEGIDLIVKLKNRRVKTVFIQVKSSGGYLLKFLNHKAENNNVDIHTLTTDTFRRKKLIPLVAYDENRIIRRFLGNLRAIEEYHVRHGTADGVVWRQIR